MAVFEVPLAPQAQTFNISLGGVTYQARMIWRDLVHANRAYDLPAPGELNQGNSFNLQRHSTMLQKDKGWQCFPGTTGLTPLAGTDRPGFFGANHVAYASVDGVPALGTYIQLASTYYLPVVANQRLEASGYLACSGANPIPSTPDCALLVSFYQVAADGGPGAYVTQTVVAYMSKNASGANGDLKNFDRRGAFLQVPNDPTIKWALLFSSLTPAGGVQPYIYLTRPYLGFRRLGQTALTDWMPNGFSLGDEREGGWVLDLADAQGLPVVQGVPLVTGVDLLAPYAYLGFQGSLVVQTDHDPEATPTYGNLGDLSHLYFVTAG